MKKRLALLALACVLAFGIGLVAQDDASHMSQSLYIGGQSLQNNPELRLYGWASSAFHYGRIYVDTSGNLNIVAPSGKVLNMPLPVFSSLTASKPVFTDASKALTSTGTMPVNQGGTNLTSYAIGDLIYASAATTLSKLADVATGSYLASGGVTTAPAWATLNQAAVAGLTTASSPEFAGATLTGFSGFVQATAGVLSAAAIADGDLPAALTGKTYNGLATSAVITPATGTGVTVNKSGTLAQQLYKVTVTYQALAAAGLTADKVIATVPAKTRIVAIYADTTTPYTGGGVTAASIIVGNAAGGAQYVATHDVLSGAVTKGLADADMGTELAAAALIQNAAVVNWTTAIDVYVRLTTVTSNTDQLTAGSTTYYIITEQL